MAPRALVFDVFGTCVDWRTAIMREVVAVARARGLPVDAAAFADAWRGLYQPSMEEVRTGRRPFVVLDVLHRESLDRLLPAFGLDGLSPAEREDLTRAWHRLDPWPDTVAGLTRLKRRFPIGTLSNGNIALMVNLARRAGLPWDVILGAEVVRQYKPRPEVYRNAAEALGLRPAEVMLVAAHNGDLRHAWTHGLQTAFIPRPTEHGPGQTTDLAPDGPWNQVAASLEDLATALGC